MAVNNSVYEAKLNTLVQKLTQGATHGAQLGEKWSIEKGRKFDKVYIQTKHQKIGRYMVNRNTFQIYGTKSWAQVNLRREFGTLDTVNQFDWIAADGPLPRVGTDAETAHKIREATISANYRKRGRPRKIVATPLHIVHALSVNTHGGQK